MTSHNDEFDQRLSEAFARGVSEVKYDADSAEPEDVPKELALRVVTRAREVSTQLLAQRVREAAEAVGWTLDELSAEAGGQESEARDFLRGSKTPYRLRPPTLARLFWRCELKPAQWRTLLTQAVSSSVFFAAPAEGQVWGRTTGLSDEERGEALVGTERDPARAERVARIFVEEVIEEWTSLTSGEKMTNEDDLD